VIIMDFTSTSAMSLGFTFTYCSLSWDRHGASMATTFDMRQLSRDDVPFKRVKIGWVGLYMRGKSPASWDPNSTSTDVIGFSCCGEVIEPKEGRQWMRTVPRMCTRTALA